MAFIRLFVKKKDGCKPLVFVGNTSFVLPSNLLSNRGLSLGLKRLLTPGGPGDNGGRSQAKTGDSHG